MPDFTLTTTADAPAEEVWKLLFDPTRFPEWWAGIGTTRLDGPGAFTMWCDGSPDDPMPQRLRTDRRSGQVMVSCQVNEIGFTWQLSELGDATGISVHVDIAQAKAFQFDRTREIIAASLPALVALAEGRSSA